MSLPIKRITISGFRGFREPFVLDFASGKKLKSAIVYGRNGTGKSSLVDGWEWFCEKKIDHLAREGAGFDAYPNKFVTDENQSYIEVEFSDPELAVIRTQYNPKRKTIPEISGEWDLFKKRLPYSCHIRFEDLKKFVYYTKTEKFKALAELMGFSDQIEKQKSLEKIQRDIQSKLKELEKRCNREQQKICDNLKLDGQQFSAESLLSLVNEKLGKNGIETIVDLTQIPERIERITRLIDSSDNDNYLSVARTVTQVEENPFPIPFVSSLKAYYLQLLAFKEQEQKIAQLLLLQFYETGFDLVSEKDDQTCPLCDQPVTNLVNHIQLKLEDLRSIKADKESLERTHQTLRELKREKQLPLQKLSKLTEEELNRIKLKSTTLFDFLTKLNLFYTELEESMFHLDDGPELIRKESCLSAVEQIERADHLMIELQDVYQSLRERVNEDLVQYHKKFGHLIVLADQLKEFVPLWYAYSESNKDWQNGIKVKERYDLILTNYSEKNIEDIQRRFDLISEHFERYFAILEKHTKGLSKPSLILKGTGGTNVQVDFWGYEISPAYRYLSESQLNSFGLAIFLASVKVFNSEMKLLILDDVINSFDAYKRPQLIDLLKEEFADYQILLLTHDTVWRDRLFNSFSDWKKYNFTGWSSDNGPRIKEGKTDLQYIKKLLYDDEPIRAGRNLGPFFEYRLQQICEAFQVELPYNKRNEYSLDPLMNRLHKRVNEKIGAHHSLTKRLKELYEEKLFRNLCAHEKNVESQITAVEIDRVVTLWEHIEKGIHCPSCKRMLVYDGRKKRIQCICGATRLTRNG